ncbi:MAG: hypothetical protein U0796_21610 [Gemmatales bacterium]
MDREQQAEFLRVRQIAIRRLRQVKLKSSRLASHICKYVELPSFGNAIAWDVLSMLTREGKSLRLYRTCWRYDQDSEAFRSPIIRLKHPKPYLPTLESGWVELRSSELHGILELLTGTRVPMYCDNHHVGFDGTSFELTMGDAFCFTTIHWWSRLPKEWLPLESAVKKLIRMFEEAWDSKMKTGQ